MRTAELIFAVHDHQPVGNLEHVFEDATRLAYRPFFAALERHPSVRFCLHQSGVLWEWLGSRHPDLLDGIQRMVVRGQVELLGGAHYEAILAVIPETDRRGQLARQAAWMERRFGVRPRGVWLAERVWEPDLVRTLVEAGVEYTLLDDTAFATAGVPPSGLDGPWLTEAEGRTLGVFPIHRRLRELVPFAPPEAAIAWLRERAAGAPEGRTPVLVLADDGEKFGLWNGTHALCYVEGWLERFLTALEGCADWLTTTTFADCLDRTPPRGRVHLSTASYPEMMEWALPPAAQRVLRRARARHDGDTEVEGFLRGGAWRQFLSRYPESNWMHQRVLGASRAVAARAAARGDTDPVVGAAREEVWRAQCNCAYWHGLFGGIYLPHLRTAVYGALLGAEAALAIAEPPPLVEVRDVDADRAPEIVLRSASLQAILDPEEGGGVFELDDLDRRVNVLDLVARREETYHEALPSPPPYDLHRKGSLLDHSFATTAVPADFEVGLLPELAALTGAPYAWRLNGATLLLERTVALALPGSPHLAVEKRVRVVETALEARYTLVLAAPAAVELRFGVEFAANLLAGDAPDRWVEIPGQALAEPRLGAAGGVPEVRRVDLVDGWRDLRVRIECDAPCDVWRAPLVTVSMSDGGPERVHQGLVLLWTWCARLEPGVPVSRTFRQGVEAR